MPHGEQSLIPWHYLWLKGPLTSPGQAGPPPQAGALPVRFLGPSLLLLVSLVLTACAGKGTFRDGIYYGQEAHYRLVPPGGPWERVSISGNDLAWEGAAGEVIAVNALCSEHGDPSLQVLTNHLLMGFEDRKVVERESLQLAGRAALRTRVSASLDGVLRELELLVLKKDGCVYDLSYLAPPSTFEARLPDFHAVVQSFEALGSRR